MAPGASNFIVNAIVEPCTVKDMRTLLLVEDDQTTREVLTVFLSTEGWDVSPAANGEEALSLARKFSPDVILSDLQMAGICGSDLAFALRETCTTHPLVVAMTASHRSTTPDGFDALLIKPFDPVELRRTCQKLLESGRITTAQKDGNMSTEAAIDPDTFQRLKKSMPPAQLRTLFEFVLTDATARVDRMNDLFRRGQDTMFRKEAHALKGGCGMVGAMRLRHLAAGAEANGIDGGPVSYSDTSQQIQDEIRRIRLMLETLLSDKQGEAQESR